MFVCPRPPFHPCTAMTALPALIMLSASAFRRPNRIRLSTYSAVVLAQLQRVHNCASYVGLPLMRFDTARLGVPEGVASPVQVDLARCLLVASDCTNGELAPIHHAIVLEPYP